MLEHQVKVLTQVLKVLLGFDSSLDYYTFATRASVQVSFAHFAHVTQSAHLWATPQQGLFGVGQTSIHPIDQQM